MEILLINRAKIAQYKQIAKSVYDDVLNQNILEAQFQDLRHLLGERLYYDLLANATSSTYTDLLNGGVYTINGIARTNEGLKKCLVYYAFARYSMFGGVTDTPFNMVEKLNGQESRPVSTEFKKTIYQNNRDIAYNVWLSVEIYLRLTNNQLFTNNCNQKRQSFKISKI